MKIKSTVKMSTYIRYIGAAVIIWMTEVDTIMKLSYVKDLSHGFCHESEGHCTIN